MTNERIFIPVRFHDHQKRFFNYRKCYQPVLSYGAPTQFRFLRGLFKRAPDARRYGQQVALRYNNIFGR